MTSHRELVLLTGTLRGMGREEPCLVAATKVTKAGTAISALAKFTVQNAPVDLPEGDYVLSLADSQKHRVKKQNGLWVWIARI